MRVEYHEVEGDGYYTERWSVLEKNEGIHFILGYHHRKGYFKVLDVVKFFFLKDKKIQECIEYHPENGLYSMINLSSQQQQVQANEKDGLVAKVDTLLPEIRIRAPDIFFLLKDIIENIKKK